MLLSEDFLIPKRTMVLFFVIDTSASMEGSKIGAVNTAIECLQCRATVTPFTNESKKRLTFLVSHAIFYVVPRPEAAL